MFLFEIGAHTGWAMGLIAIIFWSYAPDLDLELPVRHRGPTHTVWAALIAGFITAIVTGFLVWYGVLASPSILGYLSTMVMGFVIGMVGVLGHLLGDVITPMGIQPLYPYSRKRYGVRLVLAKNKLANQTLGMTGGLAVTASIVFVTL